MRWQFSSRVALGVLVVVSAVSAQNCPLPPVLAPLQPGIDIFSDAQEADLGDAMAEMAAPRVRIIEKDDLSEHLRALGNRLVQHLPPNHLNFRFYLVELPEPNAFSIAGGRVYVSRKLILFTHSEDELAGVMAHELGHIITHQTGIYMTRRFREVLGVTQAGDRNDVFTKFHQYLENYRRRPSKGESEQREQTVADQVGLFTAFRAGYSPQAYVELLDRLQETHGQTGSWLSDLFGTTKPEQRRLREAIRNMGTLPANCADARTADSAELFSKWKEKILNFSDTGGDEQIPGLVARTSLSLPLRPDIANLRFSPDGKYIIAQDESGIHILTRDPFAVLFYIPAPDAHYAEFTPDSREIVFYTRSLRVETWNIQDQARSSVHEILMREPCMQSALSVDGKLLACLGQRDLLLLDVATSTAVFTKKQFFVPSFYELLTLFARALVSEDREDVDFIQMRFSPDGRYFLAAHLFETRIAVDLSTRQQFSLPGSIKDNLGYGFAFLGPDRIIVTNPSSPGKSPVLRFPSGERIGEVPLANQLHLRSVSRGDYLLVGPLKDFPMGLLNVSAKTVPLSFKRPAADVFGDVLINERRDGELALYPIEKIEATATVKLPQARLERLHSVAVSDDLEWMAISNKTRAAVWNLSRNIRTLYLRSFDGAWFSPQGVLYIDFPKLSDAPRMIASVSQGDVVPRDDYKIGDIVAKQHGAFLLVTTPKGKSPSYDCDVEVRNIISNKPIWARHFDHEVPGIFLHSSDGTALLGWSLAMPGGHEEKYPDIKSKAGREDYLYEIVDLQSGTTTGKVLVPSNKRSIRLETARSDGGWITLTTADNQVLVLSLTGGSEEAQFFGTMPVVVSSRGMIAVEKDRKELDLYDLRSRDLKTKYVFADPIALKKLSSDGSRLLVVTDSQTAYLIDTTVPN